MRVIPMILSADRVSSLIAGNLPGINIPVKGWERDGNWSLMIADDRVYESLNSNQPSPVDIMIPFEVGDLIYVRETWGVVSHAFDENDMIIDWKPDRPSLPVRDMSFGGGFYCGHVIYRADGEFIWADDFGELITAWHPPASMPRIASRLTLRVMDVRVERLREVALKRVAEGSVSQSELGDYSLSLDSQINILCAEHPDCDPDSYMFCVDFEFVNMNIDKYLSN